MTEISRCSIIFRGLFVRVLFTLHAVLSVWQVQDIKDNPYYWLLLTAQVAVVVEAVLTLSLKRKNGEWDWFSPCICLYLVSVIPCIWLLELELLDLRTPMEATGSTGIHRSNVTCGYADTNMTRTLLGAIEVQASLLNGWRSAALQQSFLILVIFGRWILPRGTLGHKELSNLLLVHIGMAADILEFISEGLVIEDVECNRKMIILILAIWTWSLFQFPFHCFSKITDEITVRPQENGQPHKRAWFSRCIRNPDVWCSICTCVMQDGPYLIVRLYLCSFFGFANQSQVFFIAKNMIVLLLQFYRLWALIMTWEDSQGMVMDRKFRSIRRTINRLRPRSLSVRRASGDTSNERAHSSVTPADREHTFQTFTISESQSNGTSLQVPEIVYY